MVVRFPSQWVPAIEKPCPDSDLGTDVVALPGHEIFARERQVDATDGVFVSHEEGLAVHGGGGAADVACNDSRPEGVERQGEAGTGHDAAGHGYCNQFFEFGPSGRSRSHPKFFLRSKTNATKELL